MNEEESKRIVGEINRLNFYKITYGRIYLMLLVLFLCNQKFLFINQYFFALCLLVFMIIMKILIIISLINIGILFKRQYWGGILIAFVFPFGELLSAVRTIRLVEDHLRD